MITKDPNNAYLTNIPYSVNNYGFSKVLAVRKEIIHLKHIFTEVFVRKTINIEKYLTYLNISLFDYMTYMTNRIRHVHDIPRTYKSNPNLIVKYNRKDFFKTINLYDGLKKTIILDFDGVITENNFKNLYELCCQREQVHVCTANPQVNFDWFKKHNLTYPNKISPMKGKVKKIKQLIEIQKRNDMTFYIDNEIEYLNYAWLFGIQTYHWKNNKIVKHTLKTK